MYLSQASQGIAINPTVLPPPSDYVYPGSLLVPTHFVDPSAPGASDSNDGTSGNEWQTLAGLTSAPAASIVQVRDGNYTTGGGENSVVPTASGTSAGSPTQIFSETIHGVIVDNSAVSGSPAESKSFWHQHGKSNINWIGFKIENTVQHLFRIGTNSNNDPNTGATNIIVDACDLDGISMGDIADNHGFFYLLACGDIIVRHTRMSNCVGDGSQNTVCTMDYNCDHLMVENCRFGIGNFGVHFFKSSGSPTTRKHTIRSNWYEGWTGVRGFNPNESQDAQVYQNIFVGDAGLDGGGPVDYWNNIWKQTTEPTLDAGSIGEHNLRHQLWSSSGAYRSQNNIHTVTFATAKDDVYDGAVARRPNENGVFPVPGDFNVFSTGIIARSEANSPATIVQWILSEVPTGEENSIEDDLADIFVDHASGDYTTPSGKPALTAGQYESWMPTDGSFTGLTPGDPMAAGPYILGTEKIGPGWL